MDCDPTIDALKRDEDEAEKEAARRFARSSELMHERTKEGEEYYAKMWIEVLAMAGVHLTMDKATSQAKERALKAIRDVETRWGPSPAGVGAVIKKSGPELLFADLVLLGEFAKLMIDTKAEYDHLEYMHDEAQKEAAKAGELLQRGVGDFRRILDLLAACKKQREKEEKKLRDLEDLNDRAHKLMDKWDLGTGLYRDGSGQIYDAGGALNHAKQILLSGQSSHLRIGPFRVQVRLVLVAHAQAPQQEITVTVQQLTDALAEIKQAESLFSQGMDKLAQAAKLDEEIQKGLEDLVSRLGSAPNVGSLTPLPLGSRLAIAGAMKAPAITTETSGPVSKGYSIGGKKLLRYLRRFTHRS